MHFTFPLVVNVKDFTKKTVSWRGKFTEESKYVFKEDPGNDAMDWSKWGGISFKPMLDAQVNSVMMGWRYNQQEDSIEGTLYYHTKAGEAFYGKKDKNIQVFKINVNVDFVVSMDFKNNEFVFKQNATTVRTPLPYVFEGKGREINSWFGGTLPSPKCFCYWKSEAIIENENT